MAGLYGQSIVSRTSYGATVAVFKSADVGVKNPVPVTMVLGFPQGHESLGPWGCPNNARFCDTPNGTFNGTEYPMLGFPIPGTDRYISMESRADNFCYGQGTSNPALHRQPNPAAGPGEVWCYDPGSSDKGNHGYPRKNVINEWSMADMVAVYRGAKKPWDLRPVSSTAMADATSLGRGAFDPVACRAYIASPLNNPSSVRVYDFAGCGSATPPPAATDCVPGVESIASDNSATASCDVQPDGTGRRTIIENWTRTGDVLETNGGLACAPVQTPRTRLESCVVTPPPTTEVLNCAISGQQTAYADGDIRRTLRCDTNGPKPKAVNGTPFTVTIPK